jgi:hypothetical protein
MMFLVASLLALAVVAIACYFYFNNKCDDVSGLCKGFGIDACSVDREKNFSPALQRRRYRMLQQAENFKMDDTSDDELFNLVSNAC